MTVAELEDEIEAMFLELAEVRFEREQIRFEREQIGHMAAWMMSEQFILDIERIVH